MARFNLDDYETVESRLKRFWKDHPEGAVIVDNITTEGDRTRGEWVCTASIYFHHEDIRPRGTDTAFEREVGNGPQGQGAGLETCATSSVGRALANCGYSGNKRASREEMEKVQRLGNVTPFSRGLGTPIDPATANTLDELNTLWSKAVDEGRTDELQAAFTKRKTELS
jgi:hypothetical protein